MRGKKYDFRITLMLFLHLKTFSMIYLNLVFWSELQILIWFKTHNFYSFLWQAEKLEEA